MQAIMLLSLGGIISGLLAGLLGMGGGIVLVPLLSLVLPLFGIPAEHTMHSAVATSMAVITLTALSSARVHWYEGQVVWPVFRLLSIGAVPGTLMGGYLAHFLTGSLLHVIFGIFTFVIALRILFNVHPKLKRDLPSHGFLVAAGVVIGLICALLGMGGGVFMIPLLRRFDLTMRNIVSTSALCTLPIALTGTTLFLLLGFSNPDPIRWSTGYIYWPAFFATALASVIFAPLGAKMAHRISSQLLAKIFGGFLILISSHMLITGILR